MLNTMPKSVLAEDGSGFLLFADERWTPFACESGGRIPKPDQFSVDMNVSRQVIFEPTTISLLYDQQKPFAALSPRLADVQRNLLRKLYSQSSAHSLQLATTTFFPWQPSEQATEQRIPPNNSGCAPAMMFDFMTAYTTPECPGEIGYRAHHFAYLATRSGRIVLVGTSSQLIVWQEQSSIEEFGFPGYRRFGASDEHPNPAIYALFESLVIVG